MNWKVTLWIEMSDNSARLGYRNMAELPEEGDFVVYEERRYRVLRVESDPNPAVRDIPVFSGDQGVADIYVEDPEEVGHPLSNRLLALLILIPLAVIGRTAQRVLDGYRWVERQIGRIR